MRQRHGGRAHVTNTELFFDLVYVFAVTQLSHLLLGTLTPLGAVQALVLWFAVWLGWQYTCWATNWFDPQAMPIRVMLFAVMLLALVMAAALPRAFGAGGLVFAGCYAGIEVGRTLFLLRHLRHDPVLRANYQRILAWTSLSALFWLAGGLAGAEARLGLWATAVACTYVSPMLGFWTPGLGRSHSREWTIEGGHLAERCQLFVIVALGESILLTGATLAESTHLDASVVGAFLAAFLGSLAMWWMYFDTGAEESGRRISAHADPGRMGARFHYVHVMIIGGVIVAAVGHELAIAHPGEAAAVAARYVLLGGAGLYVLGNALFKTVIFGRFPLSHAVGLVVLAGLWLPSGGMSLLALAWAVAATQALVAGWEWRSRADTRRAHRA